jgi:hypothetical protein
MSRAFPFGFKLMAGAVPLLVALPLLAQDGETASAQDAEIAPFDRTPVDCVRSQNIDSTKAIDDQNLIFRMDGRKVYRNHLPRKCPGLARENRFSYETRSGRLCSIDTITVLEEFGLGFRPGFTCRLGEFVPLSPEEVEDLDLRADEAGGRQTQSVIEAQPVELDEPADEDERAEGAPAEPADETDARPAAVEN